jgi:hypothetical protein
MRSKLVQRTSQIDRVTQRLHSNRLSMLPGRQKDGPVERIGHGTLDGGSG